MHRPFLTFSNGRTTFPEPPPLEALGQLAWWLRCFHRSIDLHQINLLLSCCLLFAWFKGWSFVCSAQRGEQAILGKWFSPVNLSILNAVKTFALCILAILANISFGPTWTCEPKVLCVLPVCWVVSGSVSSYWTRQFAAGYLSFSLSARRLARVQLRCRLLAAPRVRPVCVGCWSNRERERERVTENWLFQSLLLAQP